MSMALRKKRVAKGQAWNKGLIIGKRDGFTPAQVKRIRGLLDDRGAAGLRDLALFTTAIDTMLHGQDLLRMTVGQVQSRNGSVRSVIEVAQSRNAPPVRCALCKVAVRALESWIAASGKKRTDYLFPGHGGRPLSPRQLSRLLKDWVADAGIDPLKDCRVLYNNVMVGKHGDHVGGERDAARALAAGQADAACVLDANYTVFINEGTLDPGTTRALATTPPFDHCNFTVRADAPAERVQPFLDELLAMKFEDSAVRVYMELEGLKKWLPARTSGYAQLEKAVQRFHFYGGAASRAGS